MVCSTFSRPLSDCTLLGNPKPFTVSMKLCSTTEAQSSAEAICSSMDHYPPPMQRLSAARTVCLLTFCSSFINSKVNSVTIRTMIGTSLMNLMHLDGVLFTVLILCSYEHESAAHVVSHMVTLKKTKQKKQLKWFSILYWHSNW